MKSDSLSNKELRIFSEQIELPEVGIAGQEKIKQAHILVIGTGGKGSAILQQLNSVGAGFLGLCDNYLVEEMALPRQNLYGDSDLGKQKAIVSRQHLSDINHLTRFEIHNICLTENNILGIFENYHIIVDATDNFPTHYLIGDAAVRSGKPLVFCSVYRNEGMVTVLNHENGPSFRCLFPEGSHKKTISKEGVVYGLGLLYSLTGIIAANEILKIILGKASELNGKLIRITLNPYSISFEPILKNQANFALNRFG
jgi:adenylyltransferase/sulfurtransferase